MLGHLLALLVPGFQGVPYVCMHLIRNPAAPPNARDGCGSYLTTLLLLTDADEWVLTARIAITTNETMADDSTESLTNGNTDEAAGDKTLVPWAILESQSMIAAVQNGIAVWDQIVASGWPGSYFLEVAATSQASAITAGTTVKVRHAEAA